MPEETQSSGTGEMVAVDEVAGDDIGLAFDSYVTDGDETPIDAPGADDGLSQEGEQSEGKEDVAPDATEPAPAADDAQASQSQESVETESFYKYGDQEFATPDDVGNYVKSVEGRQRQTQASHQDAMNKNAAWVDWGSDPVKLRARLAELEGDKPKETSETSAAEEKKTFLSGTDWKHLTALVDKGQGKEALATMAHMFDQVMDSRLGKLEEDARAREGKMQEGIQPMQDRQMAQEATVSLFTQAENVTDNQGNLVWPEFNKHSEQFDPQFCQVFAQVWQQLPANMAWDENLYGIEVAYNRTKQFLAAQEKAPASSPAGAEGDASASERASGAARDEHGRFVKQTEDAATAIGGSGAAPPPNTGPADSYTEAVNIVRGMDQASADTDPVFGIRR